MEEIDLDAMKIISKSVITQGYKLCSVEGKKTMPGFDAVEITAKFIRKTDHPDNRGTIRQP